MRESYEFAKRAFCLAGLFLVLTACSPRGAPPAATPSPSLAVASSSPSPTAVRILVFSRTAAFRHAAIPVAIASIVHLGSEHGYLVDATEDGEAFSDANLARYRAVVFLLTTGDVLDEAQQAAFERFIRAGGGFAGVHSASDTEYGWAWYGKLVGAYFQRHPAVQSAVIRIEDASHPSTASVPASWKRTDEWYDFRANPRRDVHVLATVVEATYSGGGMGADHPIAWCHGFDGGRSWYTAMGHAADSYSDANFLLHLEGGIESVAGISASDACAGHG
ncbi:MAG: ThuA domain-containing protein [Chloroflexi bacterium]|nr:MAG: ThuA domain-containing protein [Chloroflexota bacterium]